MLFEARYGERPPPSRAREAVHSRAGPGSLDAFDAVLSRCLAQKPRERFREAAEILVALRSAPIESEAPPGHGFPGEML